MTVNQPHGPAPVELDPVTKLPRPQPRGPRARRHPSAAAERRARGVRPPAARAEGRRGHRHHVPRRPPVAARDPGPHPRPAGGRAATSPGPTPELWSLEAWGGATYDVALRFLAEDPWERLASPAPGGAEHLPADAAARPQHRRLHAVPHRGHRRLRRGGRRRPASTCSGSSTRSTTSSRCGRRSRPCARPDTAVAEVALCYTGDLSDPGEKLYTLDYYLALAERIVDAGAHVLAIKDMAGLLRAPAARTLVTALRDRFDLPVHLHTHDTAGGQLATLLAAIDAGVDAVDAATASMAGTTSQPPLSALVAATDHSDRETGLSLAAVNALEPYWEADAPGLRAVRVRPALADRPGLPPRDPRRPAVQPAPAGDRARAGREVRADRGHVRRGQRHPRQRRQGDPVVQGRRRPGPAPGRGRRRPGRVRRGPGQVRHPRLGHRLPQRRARRPARRLAGAVPHQGARGPHLEGSRPSTSPTSRPTGCAPTAAQTLNRLLFPGPTKDFLEVREKYGDVSVLPTLDYLYGLRAGRGARGPARRGHDADLRAPGDRRARRARLPHRHGDPQRPAAPDQRPRRVGRRRGRRRREGRPVPAGPGRGAVPGRRDHRRRGGRPGRRPATPSPPSRR